MQRIDDEVNWSQVASHPYGVYVSDLEVNDRAELPFEEYVELIRNIVSEQAEGGFDFEAEHW
jgi:hypothetical protein